jgi:hypothetical protein
MRCWRARRAEERSSVASAAGGRARRASVRRGGVGAWGVPVVAGCARIKRAHVLSDDVNTMAGDRPRYGSLVSALGAILLAVSVFLPWYGVSFTAHGIA